MAKRMAGTRTGDDSLGYQLTSDGEGLSAARGLILGLVLSQIFWIALAYLVF